MLDTLRNVAVYYPNYNTSVQQQTAAPAASSLVVSGLFGLAVGIFFAICLWRIFTKAGRPGWAAIIPGYNAWTLAEVAGKPGWWGVLVFALVFLSWIPLIGLIPGIVVLVLAILVNLGLARNFGKSTTFAVVGLILFGVVGYAMLAFGSARYEPAEAETRYKGADPVSLKNPTIATSDTAMTPMGPAVPPTEVQPTVQPPVQPPADNQANNQEPPKVL